ncbi:26S proteasome non-ATPase regulatory subunit 6 [Trichuris trichiura]|uniref:26S proteasome non-ATPase regulatory subunit 6 n=1 Tax=Trichuris trichiura TaxID=36087 RepID=A0A077Z2D4_TRITR|nr:26S proteasome non-ATPase regulatory subunit 6 [Trichuris trichiura]
MDSSAGQKDVKEKTSGKLEIKSENFAKSNDEKRNALTDGTETSKDANESVMTALEATATTTNEEIRENSSEFTGDSFHTTGKMGMAISGRKDGKPMDIPTHKRQRELHAAMPVASQPGANVLTHTSFDEKALRSKEKSKWDVRSRSDAADKLMKEKYADEDSSSTNWSAATANGTTKFKNNDLDDTQMSQIKWEMESTTRHMSNCRKNSHRQISASKGEKDENVKTYDDWTKLQVEKENQATTVGTGTNEDAKQSSTPTATPRKELHGNSKGSTNNSSQSNSETKATPGGKRLISESPRDSHTDESTDGESSEAEKDTELMNVPPMELNQYYFLLSKTDCPETLKEEAKTKLMEIVKLNQMGPYYESVCKELKWPVDQELRKTLKQANDKHIQILNEKLLLAKKTRTGSDKLRSILLEKASYLCSIGKLRQSLEVYDIANDLTIGASRRMDVKMEQLRICMFLMNKGLVNSKLEEVREIDRMNVDWERRTRLKAYEGYYAMLTRDYEKASTMLLDLTCTFRSYELMTLENMVLYAVIASAIGNVVYF